MYKYTYKYIYMYKYTYICNIYCIKLAQKRDGAAVTLPTRRIIRPPGEETPPRSDVCSCRETGVFWHHGAPIEGPSETN